MLNNENKKNLKHNVKKLFFFFFGVSQAQGLYGSTLYC